MLDFRNFPWIYKFLTIFIDFVSKPPKIIMHIRVAVIYIHVLPSEWYDFTTTTIKLNF